MRWSGALAVSVFVAALNAFAGSPEVERHIATAIKLREKKHYAKALAELEKAQKKSRGPSDNVTIAIDEGVILIDLGKYKQAKAKFREALKADPDAKIPLDVSPKIEQAFENMRAETKAVSVPLAQLAAENEKPAEPAKEPESRVELVPAKQEAAPIATPAPRLVAQAPTAPEESATVTREVAPRTQRRTWALVPLGVGVAAAGVGTYFAFQAKGADDVLAGRSGPASLGAAQALQYRNQGLTDRGLAIGLFSGGAAVAAAGAFLFLKPASAETAVAVGPSGIALAGRF